MCNMVIRKAKYQRSKKYYGIEVEGSVIALCWRIFFPCVLNPQVDRVTRNGNRRLTVSFAYSGYYNIFLRVQFIPRFKYKFNG